MSHQLSREDSAAVQRWSASPTPPPPWHFSEMGQERVVPGNCCSPSLLLLLSCQARRRRGKQWAVQTGLGGLGGWRCAFVKKRGGMSGGWYTFNLITPEEGAG